ncbi:MAG: hypothetical protein P4L71_21470 [Acetobacteraceae bacterium]|nr:hypothetical protein [Acetobacteraceae bacterium]
MTVIIVSLLVSACIFAGGLVGMGLHRVLPASHMTRETQDVIRLGTGMLSVLASLVLGLLIATAKSSYDATDQAVRNYAAELSLLNEVLRDYGGAAKAPRDVLASYTQRFLRDGWPPDGQPTARLEDETARQLLEHVRETIRALTPADKAQASLQDHAGEITMGLLRQRWLLINQQGPTVQRVVLGVLVSWVTVIFVSFGLNAPRNGSVVAMFLFCSLAIGGSVFLILEMDQPLDGVMRVSSWPVEDAISHMQW